MKPGTKSTLFWLLAVVITIASAYYQRRTGPTHPARGHVSVGGETVDFSLPRSHSEEGDATVAIRTENPNIAGEISYRRYKSADPWQTVQLSRRDGNLMADLPHQPPAGKIMYRVTLNAPGTGPVTLTSDPVVIRFNGGVPLPFLIPHVLLMFTAMLLSTRTGLEALGRGGRLPAMAQLTVIILFVGGLILGPVVQKHAFGSFWTGWPFGHDMTDNKTVVAFAGWLIAWLRIRKNNNRYTAAIVAAVLLLAVYAIPHSVLGSEIDYTQVPPGAAGTP